VFVAALSHSLQSNLRLWSNGAGFGAIRTAWIARAGASGEAMSVNTGAGAVDGTYAGLDDDGALRLRRPDGSIDRITFGDVMVAGER
jgi:BirA family biotin operon repressor/biotin-[acetyl-CoA-carboxylase] ligase